MRYAESFDDLRYRPPKIIKRHIRDCPKCDSRMISIAHSSDSPNTYNQHLREDPIDDAIDKTFWKGRRALQCDSCGYMWIYHPRPGKTR